MTIYCAAQTYAATRLEPAEYCTEEVPDFGDLCSRHDEDARADELYEAWLDDQQENHWGD